MKKSIKYAGIAAATLLAVAPVAAPVVSSTETTVQAADTNTNESLMNAYAGQFTNSTLSQAQQDALVKVGNFGKMSLADFNTGYLQFAPKTLNDNQATYKALTDANATANATATVSAVTSNGTKVSSATELDNYLTDSTTKAVKITVQFNYTDQDGVAATPINETFTVTKASVDTTADLTSAAVTYDKTANVTYGTSAADYKLVASADLSVKDNNGDELVDATDGITPSISQQFYTSYNDAYNQTNPVEVSTFNKENTTYYQVITGTFAKDSAFATLLTNHATTPANYGLTVNGTTPTGSYTDPTSFQTASLDSTGAVTTDKNKIVNKRFTLIRQINVGSEEAADWTTEDVDGVVTTKSDSAYYTLKNDDNDTVSNRALAKNTAWKTNAVRTNSNGDKQYRVATGEWIDANDVTFSDGSSSSEGAYTDVQALNGKVTLDGPSSFIYMLYNDNGETVSNRALAGDSAWYTDKKATNAAGVTVYHVATGEWVQAGSGVNYVAY